MTVTREYRNLSHLEDNIGAINVAIGLAQNTLDTLAGCFPDDVSEGAILDKLRQMEELQGELQEIIGL